LRAASGFARVAVTASSRNGKMPGIARRPAEKLPPASATLGHHARSTIEQLTDLSTTSRDITAPIATVNRPTELITHTAERAIGNLRRRSTRNHPSPAEMPLRPRQMRCTARARASCVTQSPPSRMIPQPCRGDAPRRRHMRSASCPARRSAVLRLCRGQRRHIPSPMAMATGIAKSATT